MNELEEPLQEIGDEVWLRTDDNGLPPVIIMSIETNERGRVSYSGWEKFNEPRLRLHFTEADIKRF